MKKIILLLLFISPTLFAQSFEFDSLSYPFAVKKIKLQENTEIAYTDEGKGDYTLLFIHGLGSYLPAWKKNIADLHKDFRCIAIDLAGYGKSSKNPENISLAFYATTIKEMIEKLKLKNVVLVGHSMGGQIALTFAAKYPMLIQRLVLFAPAGLEEFNDAEAQMLKNYTAPAIIQATSDAQIKQNLKINFFQMPEDASFMAEDRIKMKQAKDFPAYCQVVSKCVASMLDEPVFKQLEAIKTKTLLIFGENDALIPNKFLHANLTIKELTEKAKSQMSNAEILLIPETGHFVQFEKADLCNESIRNFLKKK